MLASTDSKNALSLDEGTPETGYRISFQELVARYSQFENNWSARCLLDPIQACDQQCDLLSQLQQAYNPELLSSTSYTAAADDAVTAIIQALERTTKNQDSATVVSFTGRIFLVQTLGVLGQPAQRALPTLLSLIDVRFPSRTKITLEAIASISTSERPTAKQIALYVDIAAAASRIALQPNATYDLRECAAFVVLLFGCEHHYGF